MATESPEPASKSPKRLRQGAGACLALLLVVLWAFWPLRTPLPAVAQEDTPPSVTTSASPAAPGTFGAPEVPPLPRQEDPRLAPPDLTIVGASLGFLGGLIVFYALFSMAETALVSVRRSRVEQLVEEGARGAVRVQRLIADPPRFIATVQVGITLMGFAAATVAATSLARPLIPRLIPLGLSVNAAEVVSTLLVTLVIALVAMVLGEIAPKSLAAQQPDVWALRLAPFVSFWSVVFKPITATVLALSSLIVRPFGARAQFQTPMITKEELERMIDQGAHQGEFDRGEQEIITNVIDFSDTLVRSVMTPRIDMTALPVNADLMSTVELILKSGHSRIPVYEETIDNIVGIVHAKDLLPIFRNGGVQGVDLKKVMRTAHFVPETKKVSELLGEMRRSNQQIVIVQDEYAGTEGLVTVEDLLEELVGEIRDEYDLDEPDVQVISATESLVDGRMSIDDVSDRLGLDLPHEDFETIGGLVFGLLGHEPEVGERVRIDGYEFIVEQVEGRRIRTIRALKADSDAEDTPTDSSDPVVPAAA